MPHPIRSILFSLALLFSIGASQAVAQAVTRSTPNFPGGQQLLGGQQMTVYLTGYSYWDNTPRGSTAIAKPVIHRGAGGKGTYRDPITLAVGHVINGRRQTLDFPAGTRFYFPRLRKYAIVEDVCGDGHNPQNGPCHSGRNGHAWVDIYVDGRRSGESASNSCMNRITGIQNAIINPRRDYAVESGALTESGCQTF